jgi:hypothetical protein
MYQLINRLNFNWYFRTIWLTKSVHNQSDKSWGRRMWLISSRQELWSQQRVAASERLCKRPLLGNTFVTRNIRVTGKRSVRQLRDVTAELLGDVFSVRPLPRLYNEVELLLQYSFETAVKRVGGWCEMAASLGVKSFGAVSEFWDSRQPVMAWTRKLGKLQHCKPPWGESRWR